MSIDLWKNRLFLRLWMAQLSANIGDQCYSFALLWHLLQTTRSGTVLSFLAIPEMVAGLLFYLIGGVLADRYSPRRLMVGSDMARILIAISVGIMAVRGVEQFFCYLVAQFLLGVFSSLFQPARTVALKTVVPMEQLGKANAILDTTMRTIRILAPMTIGLIASSVPLFILFFVNACSYFFSACFLYSIRSSLLNKLGTVKIKMTPIQYRQDIAVGLAEMKRSRSLLLILLFSSLGFLVWQVCWNVGFPFLADGMGQGTGSTLALLIGSYGIGNLIGSLYMARARYTRHLFIILMGWSLQSFGCLLLTLGVYQHWVAYMAAVVAGVGGPLIGIPTVTAIQMKASDGTTGKVFGIYMLIFTSFCMLSSTLGALWLGKWPIEQLFLASSLFLLLMISAGFVLERRGSKEQAELG